MDRTHICTVAATKYDKLTDKHKSNSRSTKKKKKKLYLGKYLLYCVVEWW